MTKNKKKYNGRIAESKIALEEKGRQRIKLAIIIPVIALAVLLALIFISSRGESQSSIEIKFTAQALNIDNNSTHLAAGKESLLTFRLTDNKTGKPISELSPEINFYLPGEHDPTKEHKHFDGQHFTGKVNMAKLQLFVLNSERGTIEVLDTFGNYDPRSSAIRKLGTMTSKVISLKGSPRQKVSDMVAGRYGDYVYATLSGENQVAVISTITHEAVKYIDAGTMPGRMFSQPKSKYLWVSNDGGGTVSIIDTDNNVLTKTIETGKGYHQVAFSPKNAYITNSEDDTVTVISLDDQIKQRDIEVERGSYGIDYSNVSDEVYIANILQGTVTIIDATTHKIKQNIPLDKGVETIRFSPDGRLGIVINQHANTAHIIDVASSSLIRTVKTGEAPGAVDFMGEYALIRNTYSPDVTYISMVDPGVSNNAVVGIEPTLTWMPHSLITTAYSDEAVVTSPREGKIYFMHKMNGEPMVMNSATVEYGSDAVAIVENKLHETSPGIYQQYIKLDREGPYIIEFRTQKINSTFRIDILPDQKTGPITTAIFKNKTFLPGKPTTLQYFIKDGKTGQPEENLTDLMYIIIKPDKATWTKRLSSKYVGNGTYEAKITFPEEGDYMITLTSKTLSNKGYETAYDYVTVRNTT